jgi:imidazole glycerol-phosphate synthase subunit HisF
MYRPRLIPVLLLRNLGLVKSVKFKNHRYIGDPINAVKIFNDKKADELVFLDINATNENRCIPLEFVHKVGDEANMPFAVGGGIKTIENIREILNYGAEKIIINTEAHENPDFIKRAADSFGSSTITVCIDIKKKLFSKEIIVTGNGKEVHEDPVSFAQKMEEYGAGEIIIQSIDKDGTYEGYDLQLIKKISVSVTIPVIALGGAGQYSHLRDAVNIGLASAVAAGSIFVFHGPRKAVLISYPSQKEIKEIFD